LANPREHELTYPWAEPPAIGTVTRLRDGLYWLRMPLPFALDHINLWLCDDVIDGVRGWTVIDCGIASDDIRAAWERLFDTVFEGRPLLRVVTTHFHPDHFGLADWLARGGAQSRWQVAVWMTLGEYAFGRMLAEMRGPDAQAAGERAATHFGRNGLADPEMLQQIRARGVGYYPRLVPSVPMSFHRLRDGDELTIGTRTFRVIVGFGHAPEHMSLYCDADELLIAGDMVLPRISTNVSVFEIEPDGNPLPAYLRSLDTYLPLPAAALVLPSHGLPFVGLHARVDQQHEHHRDRLEDVFAACASPQSAAQIVPVLFKRKFDLHQMTFAIGESLAHLHALWYQGRLARQLDDDGVYRFVAAAAQA
jgi:glyoxylase-like metal-dependent hydrolase (beta-lactamase superfamily II)